MAEVPLAEAITKLRRELRQAMDDGDGEPLKFELDSVVLELEVGITTTGGADAKVGLWSVVTLGSSVERERGSLHKLTLTLSPRLADAPGKNVLVGDEVTDVAELPSAATPDRWTPGH
ncbi:trypco2 family protein [Streptomyces prunicolor]